MQKAAPESALINKAEVTKLEKVGRGGRVIVYKGKWRDIDVAIKECGMSSNRTTQELVKAIESEARIHVSLQHRNIVSMFGYYGAGTDFNIVCELMHASLDSLIYPDSSACTLDFEQRMFICKEFTQ